MNITPKHILLFTSLALLLANRIFQNKPFFAKHSSLIRILVFLLLIGVLVMEFIKSKSYVIFIVAALGVFAIGWIIYDMNRKVDDEDSLPENKDEAEKE
jgi:Ca2+/Na+ antiporter